MAPRKTTQPPELLRRTKPKVRGAVSAEGSTVAANLTQDARVVVTSPSRVVGSRGTAIAPKKAASATLQLKRLGKWADVTPRDLAKHVAQKLLKQATPKVLRTAELLGQLGTRLAPLAHPDIDGLRLMTLPALASMDPRLVLTILNRRTGKATTAIASSEEDEVAVLARVVEPDAWEALPGVSSGARLGQAPDGSYLVSARIEIDRIQAIRTAPGVLSLKASMPMQTALAQTTSSMRVCAGLLPATVAPGGGAGVVIGIIDIGCDFAHQNFRRADGTSRVLALWNQAGTAMPNSPYGYGRLYSSADIDAALQQSDPYIALGYPKLPNANFLKGIHGTHVTDIAAGNGRGSTVAGVAPEADIVFVDTAVKELSLIGAAGVGSGFGDSVQMVEAIKFVLDKAAGRPCVINLSLGTNGGPHDGSSLVEQSIDALVTAAPNRAVVIAASNSQDDNIHTMGQVAAGATLDLGWNVGDYGAEVEIWYAGSEQLEVTLLAPDGTSLATAQPGRTAALGSDGNPAVFISSRLGDPNNGDNLINIGLAPGMPSGAWTIRLRSLTAQPATFHAWIERFDPAQSTFANPVASHMLGSIATGRESIVVGAYDAHKPTLPLSYFSSAGPTRDGRQKPEISAPGHNVMAARSMTGNGIVKMSGTSMAAPAVTGLVALMLAEAVRNGGSLTSAQIRQRLIAGAELAPPAGGAGTWDSRYGFGRASATAI